VSNAYERDGHQLGAHTVACGTERSVECAETADSGGYNRAYWCATAQPNALSSLVMSRWRRSP
jgi:hypothetical protein